MHVTYTQVISAAKLVRKLLEATNAQNRTSLFFLKKGLLISCTMGAWGKLSSFKLNWFIFLNYLSFYLLFFCLMYVITPVSSFHSCGDPDTRSITVERGDNVYLRDVYIDSDWPITGEDLVLTKNIDEEICRCNGQQSLYPSAVYNISCECSATGNYFVEIGDECDGICFLEIHIISN